jgi:glucosamine-6-phosphate isomerase
MKLNISEDFAGLSRRAADDLEGLVKSRKNPLLCVASGDSPSCLYQTLVERVRNGQLDLSQCLFLGLDEWVGLSGADEGSCRYHLDKQFFRPLQVPEGNICFFNGRAQDLNRECLDAESFINRHGGIELSILGLGLNGHVGMNEPGTSIFSRSHVTALDPLTTQTGQKYFKEKQSLKDGITLGIATLLESRNIFLLVSGVKKAQIIKKVLEGEITDQVPASLLRSHPGLHLYLDKEAAGLLRSGPG